MKSLDLSPELLDELLPPTPFAERANGKSSIVLGGEAGGAGSSEEKEIGRRNAEHGWSMASVAWSRQVAQHVGLKMALPHEPSP